jgi:hypothetical protein
MIVTPEEPVKGTPEWFGLDKRRNEGATRARLRRDAAKPVGVNLKEGAALSTFAQRLAAGFAKLRQS